MSDFAIAVESELRRVPWIHKVFPYAESLRVRDFAPDGAPPDVAYVQAEIVLGPPGFLRTRLLATTRILSGGESRREEEAMVVIQAVCFRLLRELLHELGEVRHLQVDTVEPEKVLAEDTK